jgi:uncharacterized protein YpmB
LYIWVPKQTSKQTSKQANEGMSPSTETRVQRHVIKLLI